MTAPPARWGPDPTQPDIQVLVQPKLPGGLKALLAGISTLRRTLDVPVQAVWADRVLGRDHLIMAATHARRALEGGRSRADDPAVEFLLYGAAHRQIHHALSILGVPAEGAEAHVVVLAPVDDDAVTDAAQAAGLASVPVDLAASHDPLAPTAPALAYWRGRLGLPDDAAHAVVEDALLAAMADLAVARA